MLLVLGLLIAPVTCDCGAGVPHGYSIFHNHTVASDDDDQHKPTDVHPEDRFEDRTAADFDHQPHPLIASSLDGTRHLLFSGTFMLANALEKKDSAVVNTLPISSFGQPMVMAQLASAMLVTLDENEPIDLPGTRTLEGTTPSPEPPPPRA